MACRPNGSPWLSRPAGNAVAGSPVEPVRLAANEQQAAKPAEAAAPAEAEAEAVRAVEFDPDHDRGHATLGWALFKQGRTAEGLAELERAVALAPMSAQWLAQLGEARALAGDAEAAREILAELERRAETGFVASYNLAYVHTGLGDHDRAIDHLERAMEERTGAVYGLKGSFLLAPLRDHPRFQALLARMNLS